jgi:ribonucrease Y
MDIDFVSGAGFFAGGVIVTYLLLRWKEQARLAGLQAEEKNLLGNAKREADHLIREARLSANEEALKLREETEKSFAVKRESLTELEKRLAQFEAQISAQSETLRNREKQLTVRSEELAAQREQLEAEQRQVGATRAELKQTLERIGKVSEADARAALLKEVEITSLKDAADLARHILEEARTRAEEQARRIISTAIQRYAGSHTFEVTTATLAITGDEIKGRIIGRDGRNIRAFEAATGITVLIDDTPNAVVLSGFDPVRREIAREAMARLIQDGRIHPTRIEEVVGQVSTEMDANVIKWGEEAVATLGLPPLHTEILKKLGALKFRYSFSQNILNHSIEVAQLMALMAAELGLDTTAAKKSGLLHDIGKALDHEIEGPHAIVGGDFIKNHGESDDIVNAVASHHDEVPHLNPLGILVSAADAISASRPGARAETMTTYLKRLESLEKIGLSFPGVEKAYAVQAGRELRIFVRPEFVTDDEAFDLARKIVRKIEDELQYPGQIRVTVVRETKVTEYAK